MYLDVKGLVTTGTGNLIDPVGSALALPWQNSDGSSASQQQISDAWNAVKNAAQPGTVGGKDYANIKMAGQFAGLTSIRLSTTALQNLFNGTASSFESTLKGYFPNWDKLPAPAQLCIMSMAWALGPHFPANYPKFTAALKATPIQWDIAIKESYIPDTNNPGLVPRNAANKALLTIAQSMDAAGADLSLLPFDPASVVSWMQNAAKGIIGGTYAATKRNWGKLLIGGAIASAVLYASYREIESGWMTKKLKALGK